MPHVPDEPGLRVRVAVPADAPRLSALAGRSKGHWGYDEAFMAACHTELTVVASDLARGLTFVLERGCRVLGFHALEPLSEASAELGFLFVEPSEIGKGYGRTLIEHAKGEALSRGFRELLVQGDPHASRFYEAAGGRRVGERDSASIPGRRLPLFVIPLDDISQ